MMTVVAFPRSDCAPEQSEMAMQIHQLLFILLSYGFAFQGHCKETYLRFSFFFFNFIFQFHSVPMFIQCVRVYACDFCKCATLTKRFWIVVWWFCSFFVVVAHHGSSDYFWRIRLNFGCDLCAGCSTCDFNLIFVRIGIVPVRCATKSNNKK